MKSISIDYLANHPEYIPVLAHWQQKQWFYISPHLTTQKRIDFMQNHPARASVPTTCIALTENDLMGSASLVENDMEDYSDFGPWLASVYVTPKYRNQSAATTLIDNIANQARQLNYHELYLFTTDQDNFYARRGWETIKRTRYHDELIDIMLLKLC